jgi:hypothetical protein
LRRHPRRIFRAFRRLTPPQQSASLTIVTEDDARSKTQLVDAPRAGLGARIVEWFWRGASLAKQRSLLAPRGERGQLLARRARVSADLANIAHISQPLEPSHDAIASELYRQSAYWAARALSEDDLASSADVAKAWDALDEASFSPPVEGVVTADALRELARTGSFVHFAELSTDEQRRARLSLRQLAETLLARFDERTAALRSLRAQRIWRVSALLVLVLGVSALSSPSANSGVSARTTTSAAVLPLSKTVRETQAISFTRA